jgi:cytochrome c peroxidase
MAGGRGSSSAGAADNTPDDNRITDEGATLGRVLFYDTRLSENETVSCATCHQQERGFSTAERLSTGLHGESTARRSMGLANARFYSSGRFFWDERAASLEEQVLIPIQDPVEMGMDLAVLEDRLAQTAFYSHLFEEAFGSPDISSDRISKALAQFVRSMVSVGSKYDRALELGDGRAPDPSSLTEQELLGQQLFESRDAAGGGERGGRGMGAMGGMRGMGPNITCSECHTTTLQIADRARNNGLDASITDEAAGGGRFKVPSLRNVAVRAPYMHDGRFETLRDVVEFYNTGVQRSRNLDRALMHASMHGLEFSDVEVDAIVAFLETLTDEGFLNDPKFSDPFER